MAPFLVLLSWQRLFFIVRLRRERRLRIGGLLFAHSRVEHLLPHPVHFLHTVEINGREQVCRYSQRFRVFRNLLPICLLIAYDQFKQLARSPFMSEQCIPFHIKVS